MFNEPSRLYLIPSPLEKNAYHTIPTTVFEALTRIQVFFVENEKLAKAYVAQAYKRLNPNHQGFVDLSAHEWLIVDERLSFQEIRNALKTSIQRKVNVGVISDAGCPCVADPGSLIVECAHELQLKVLPLIGPNSLILALMASGFNGQKFEFHGYLPINSNERKKRIRELESDSQRENLTQLFIETPYRNLSLFQDLLTSLQPTTKLCIAANLTAPNEFIYSASVSKWLKINPPILKIPAIFLLLA